ncbi:DUF7527 domain-containing protein [Haloarchaeobius baliensis]|uniref:DUF7527 domain-containing protein n=1 Tax=Haloarchaeobius baliensis TaxID=1670458 RepID=UPI003F884F71
MDSRRVERVEDWDSRPFSGGFEELRTLADTEFSGAVTTGTTWLFMLNGRIIGVFDGTIDDFDGSSGTTYEAPHPSVPLLFAMQETGGQERANYYTNDTPVSEADSTLTSGNFTGYIELSENVLSGDYYVVYYGGRSMSCAFIGNQERLHTGDEAFERADDEVGIYTVMDVDIEVTDIPSPEPEPEPEPADDAGDAATGAAAGTTAGAAVDGTSDQSGGQVEPTDDPVVADPAPDEGAEQAEPAPGGQATDERPPATGGQTAAVDDETVSTDEQHATTDEPVVRDAEQSGRDQRDPGNGRGAHPSSGAEPDDSRPAEETSANSRTARSRETGADPTQPVGEAGAASPAATDDTDSEPVTTTVEDDHDPVQIPDEVLEEVEREAAAEEGEDPVFEEEAEWRETRSIPSINPDHSESPDRSKSASPEPTAGRQSRRQRQARADTTQSSSDPSNSTKTPTTSANQPTKTGRQARRTEQQSTPTTDSGTSDEPLEREMLQREDKIDRLQQRLSNVEEERTELREERDQLADENADLRGEVEELEAEIAELEAELTDLEAEVAAQRGPAADAGTQLTPQQALEGTNLFVRYGSKGEATLDTAHDGEADADAVNTNLRIEHHTQFEADDAAVDGQSYVDFLHDSIEFRFVEWFVRDLLYEIRDTGNASAMSDLYDAIPEADRAELDGSVSLRYDEDGNEQREQTTFDVVVRDRMGNPLVVANLNDSRDPTTEEMMVDLQERASRVKRTSESLAGAVVVTASFFDPGALETASEATSGSFLSRDSKKSFVKLSRKSGYHLCLVESRGGEFHINVPEL